MQNEPLNTASIQQFIMQVKNADASNSREVKLTMPQAKNLAYTLGVVMARLEGDLERYVKDNSSGGDIEVRLDGGGNWK
ncbi:hypothetical protein N9D61_09855 [Planktomarina sp.]|jgi:hypothetical protein|nr:hypothetical protein [Planktomarina sp.]